MSQKLKGLIQDDLRLQDYIANLANFEANHEVNCEEKAMRALLPRSALFFSSKTAESELASSSAQKNPNF